jgi:hypothetical protein
MSSWNALKNLVNAEFSQALEEGRDAEAIEALRGEYAAAGDDEAQLRAVWQKILQAPQCEDWTFDEPSDLETLRARRSEGPRRFPRILGDEELEDKMHGAWLGRCIGCALGKPVEAFMGAYNGLSSTRISSATTRFPFPSAPAAALQSPAKLRGRNARVLAQQKRPHFDAHGVFRL